MTRCRCEMTHKEQIRWLEYANEGRKQSCWEWSGSRAVHRGGYGMFSFRGKAIRAHRFSYEYYVSKIPRGRWVLHLCDNPPCVNPRHLFLGDNGANMRDAVRKGRHVPPRGENNSHAKLNNEKVREIRRLVQTISCGAVGRLFQINRSAVVRIKNRERWAHVT